MKDLILFPYGGNNKEAISIINDINKKQKQWNILGFVDDNKDLWGIEFAGYKVLGGKDIINNFPEAKILAVPGSHKNYYKRDKVIDLLQVDEERFISLIHPSVQIGAEVNIGYNTLIMHGVVMTAEVTIGNHCVILPNTVISHESKIEDYCMIGSNVSISGNVLVKKQCYIGTGSKLIQDLIIEEKTLVGMGSVVVKSTQSMDVIAGCPAKFLRKQEVI